MTRRMATVLLLCLLSSAVLVLTPSAAAGGACYADGPISSSRAEGDATVLIEKCQFESTVLYIEPGSTVTWDNNDPMPHSVTGAFRSIGGEKLIHASDDPLSFRFDNAGVFPYYCVLHPGMAGAVVVGDVDDLKASAPLDADAVAAPISDDAAPPGDANENREETSSNAAPIAIGAGVVALLIVAAIAVLRRKPALQA